MYVEIWEDGKQPRILEHVNAEFVILLEDLLAYGAKKHGKESFQYLIAEDKKMRTNRLQTENIMSHIILHLMDYGQGKPHDYFKDWEHQLAAVAVNAMMEFILRNKGFK